LKFVAVALLHRTAVTAIAVEPPGATVTLTVLTVTLVMLTNGALELFAAWWTAATVRTAGAWTVARAIAWEVDPTDGAVRTAPEETLLNAPIPMTSPSTITAKAAVVPSLEAQDRRIGQVTTFIT
jgi:hypothetical protein